MYFLNVSLKSFSAAHRLLEPYRGKCNHLHGHNYALQVMIGASEVGADGLVVDFAKVRELCNGWVQSHLDHATLVCQKDQQLVTFLQQNKQKYYSFQKNTSVEVIACEVFGELKKILQAQSAVVGISFKLQQIEIWESNACGVIYTEADVLQRGSACGH